MAELLISLTGLDAPALPALLGETPGRGRALSRIVVDAHVAAGNSAFAAAARRAGVPFLVDPDTFYLQDRQHSADAWARLPFATAALVTVDELLDVSRADRLVAEAVEFQLGLGATAVIAPYVHIETGNDGWTDVQRLLYQRTRRYLDRQHVSLPVIAPVALSWRLLGRTSWPASLDPLMSSLRRLEPAEVALAGSRVHQGVRADQRLTNLYAATAHLARRFPVIAWRQGLFGEACVAAGAAGYETGIGWNETCNLRASMAQRRAPRDGGGGRPVYIERAGLSLPLRTIRQLMTDPQTAAALAHLDVACCPLGKQSLLGDARGHAVTARAARLAAVSAAEHPRWAWQYIADRTTEALTLAAQINRLADRGASPTRLSIAPIEAVAVTAAVRRRTANRHHAA